MQSYKLYELKHKKIERGLGIDCGKTLHRRLTERDYPTAIGTKVYWYERAGRVGKKAKTYRCGIIKGHAVSANGIPQYVVKLLWTTARKGGGKVKLDTRPGDRRPFVSVLEAGKLENEEKASLGMIREFGYSLKDFQNQPNTLLPNLK